MVENDIKSKVRQIFTKLANTSKGISSKEKNINTKSIYFTKTALPIVYSNLILIEDMNFENSNYFLGSNGFVSKKITLSSLKHDHNFNLSNCVFRIFPRTYNVNKYKVLDFINKKAELDIQDTNFKFSAEIFNNLDIIQNKFGEPVRYGDIIMLMHENSHMFIKYVNSTKSLTFSNHDGDATLFSVEPATEIMLNDNQILKSGQPIRLKVAGFNNASQNLFFGLSVPYSSSNKNKENEILNDNEDNSSSDEENEQEEESSDNIDYIKDNNNNDKLNYDKKIKKYEKKPDLVVEENSRMNWRFVLYNPFTINEDLISYGDFIQIIYCEQNGVIGAISEGKEEVKRKIKDLKKSTIKPKKKEESLDLKENILMPNDEEILIDDVNDNDLIFNNEYKNTEFYINNQASYSKNSSENVNSTWILENIYPHMKMQSFIRFYDDEKLDTYRMAFRIKHFKTNKILSITEVKDESNDKLSFKQKGIMKGAGVNDKKIYKFTLLDNNIENLNEQIFLSHEYQYSLFGFKKTNKSKSYESTKPSINDFLKLFHVNTQCYIKILTDDSKKKTILDFDDILKCYLTLIKYPDEKEVVKIERIHHNTQWKFKFVQNLYNLTCYIIKNIKQVLGEAKHLEENDSNNNEDVQKINFQHKYMDDFSGEEYLDISNFKKLKFVLNKLFKFVLNKFVNKYNDNCGFNNIVNNRQLLISHFDFSELLLVKLIYFYWLHDNNLGRIKKIGEILNNVRIGSDVNNYLNNNLSMRDKILYQMFRYTETIFQFMVIYCKDNSEIKKELYKYLYIFFIFINLSGSCVDVLIEIFKNEESNINFIIRDCTEKKNFKNTLELLFKEYFPEYKPKMDGQNFFLIDTNTIQNSNSQDNKMLTLFDLILEYIKISKYAHNPKYDEKQIRSNEEASNCVSFNSREKYIELLITLVHMDDKANIQDNQIYLIKKIIKQFADSIILDPNLSGEEKDYPPCLISLIYELAKDSRINDENNANTKEIRMLHEFIFQNSNFREDKLEDINSDSYIPCNSKMYAYIKENRKNEKEDQEKVSKFFEKQKLKIISLFTNKDTNKDKKTWIINYLDSQEVEIACSTIKFMKDMLQIDLLSPQKEKDFLNFLISFLRLKYIIFSEKRQMNIILQVDMVIKEKSILERITKIEHEKYISISQTWHKIYQIFRRFSINIVEENFYIEEKKKKEKNNFKHLKTRQPGDPPIFNKNLINDDENNITSVDNLEDTDENRISKGQNEKGEDLINDHLNEFYNVTDIDKKSEISLVDKNKNSNVNLFDKKDGETKNYVIITKEDLKKQKKILLTKNIISIFRLLIRKNINCLKKNFIEYYLHKTNSSDHFVFDEFVQKCVPCLEDGNDNINKLIRRYCEPKIENNHSSIGYINLNNFLGSKTDDLNFIQNIIISFATSEEEEIQEILIGLIYKYFHQRKTLFRDIIKFNEQLLPDNREKVRSEFNNRGQDIKIIFNQFFKNYEMSKNRYDEDKAEKIEFFLNSLIKEILFVLENIFNYFKAELIFKENSNYDKKKIENMINKIKLIENSTSRSFTQEVFLENLSQISYFLYYIRSNSEDQNISSIVSILSEHGELYIKMFFSLLNDLISKGKNISSCFEEKSFCFFPKKDLLATNLAKSPNDVILSIKNKYFTSFSLLILLSIVILPKDDKILNYLINLLEDKKDLLKFDSYSRYLILLLISDIQKLSFSMDYFFIFKKCQEFSRPENFGVLEANLDNSEYPVCFSTLYLDIIYNVLSFIIYKNKMINETYLDEIITDIFLLLLKKINMIKGFNFCEQISILNDPNSKDKIKLLIKLIKTINIMSNIEQLNRVIMLKIDPMNSNNFNNEVLNLFDNKAKKISKFDNTPIVKYYPQPHNLYQLFINNLHELYNDTGHKLTELRGLRYVQNIFEMYKYMLYYITFINTNYFLDEEGDAIEEKKKIKDFILYILYGYSFITNKFENKMSNLDFLSNQSDEMKRLLEQITFSSFHLLLNQIAYIKYFDFCHKDIIGIKIEHEQVNNNFIKLFNDFETKTKNMENMRGSMNNIENNFKLSTEINCKTTENSSVNIYILNKIEEIFVYSMMMDMATTVKTKKEDNENNDNTHDKKKEEKFPSPAQYRNILSLIKKMIVQYQNRESKSKMNLFQNMLLEHKKDLHVFERKEATSIIYYILSFIDGKNKSSTEQIFTQFIQKSVDFINNTLILSSELTSKRIKHMTYLIYIIKKILSFYEKNENDLLTSDFRKKTLREIQMVIEKTGLIRICLLFITRYNEEKILPFINEIFKMFCKMLKFGENNKSDPVRGGSNGQKLFYSLFNTKKDFEQVFCFMTETINKKIQTIISNKFLIIRNKKKTISIQNQLLLEEYGGELDENILEFLQLLCENHNRNLQLYLHKQNNFRRDYDLVTDTQHYLNILFNNFEPFLFNSLCRCFDLLIEMIQGPCFESQLLLINSKLLVTINDLLKYYLISETDQLKKKFPDVSIFNKSEDGFKEKEYKEKEEEEDIQESTSFKKNFYKMSTKQISLLTYKATILLQALVDSRNKFDPLYGNMINIISGETLEKLFKKVYFEHLTLISETNETDDYLIRLSDFNRANKIDEEIEDEFDLKQEKISKSSSPEEYLILETGFYTYFLWRYYDDYNSTKENKKNKEEKKASKCKNFIKILKTKFFVYELLRFIWNLIFAVLKTICLIIGIIIQCATFGRVKKFNLIRDIFNHTKYKDEYAYNFYKQKTASIEVLRDENVYVIYFFKLPFCNGLNKFERTTFLESMDTNPQSKLMDIMRYSDKVKYELESDYKIKEFASQIPIFGVILANIEFWKNLSLVISIFLNIINFLSSHYEQTAYTLCVSDTKCIEVKKWEEIQTLGGLDEDSYDKLINSLSLFQCIIGCLIYAEYMARKSPSIYKLNREQAEELNYTGKRKTLYILQKTVIEIATSFAILYYTGVVIFGFLGIYKSNFFFSYLLLEIVTRFKTLQNVLLAIKNPYKELLLIFILWIILIYYFSIIGYLWYRDTEFPRPDKDCNSLLKCVATIFHQNNRMDNGISGYLIPRNEKQNKNPFTWRFFYDEIGNLMLKILIVNMISGIIIDNFAALRKSETKMINDMNNICTICSLKKDKILKVYKNYGKDYNTHKNNDHYVFNYIFYIIYLYKKEKTELNGMESYIYESAFIKKDITWFPMKKLYIAKPEELEIDSDEEDDDEDSDD